jgi:methyl-accepting chemotaxis protein
MFKNMKIGQRMAMGFGLLLVVMLVLIWQGVQGMAGIQANLQRIVSVNNVRTDLCHEVNSDLRELFINVRNIISGYPLHSPTHYWLCLADFPPTIAL